MKQYVRCKACGFITEAGKEGDKCGACGVPKTAFEPYKYTLSEKRLKLIEIHMHPIILHFPQAFTIMALFLLVVAPIFSGDLKNILLHGAYVLLAFLAPAVIAGFLTGLIDGKLRFKKVTTPILKLKIMMGSAYILLSILCTAIVFLTDLTGLAYYVTVVALLICTALAILLGRYGSSLMESKLPGA